MNKLFTLLVALILLPGLVLAQLAIKGEKVYTMDGPVIENGVVLIKNGKIDKVGPASTRIPKDYRIIEAAVVTPGLIDAHSTVGFSGYMNQPHDQDQLEMSSPIQPELRAIDAYNAREELVAYLQSWGITTVHTGHGPGATISGQTLIAKTRGDNVNEAVIDESTMLAMTIDPMVSGNFESPGTSAKQIAMIRSKLIEAQAYKEKMEDDNDKNDPPPNIQLDILVKLLNKETRALITANRQQDILSALRIANEFDLDIVLDEVTEAYLLTDELKAAGVPIILHSTRLRATGSRENVNMESAALLHAAGIPVSIKSGFEAYVPKTRVVLFEAANAVANGLPYEEGLKSITLNPAQLLGIDDRVGSLEKGKDADVVLYDGDPFEYLTKVCYVIIDGEVVKEGCGDQ